jgi:hypothetical protein
VPTNRGDAEARHPGRRRGRRRIANKEPAAEARHRGRRRGRGGAPRRGHRRPPPRRTREWRRPSEREGASGESISSSCNSIVVVVLAIVVVEVEVVVVVVVVVAVVVVVLVAHSPSSCRLLLSQRLLPQTSPDTHVFGICSPVVLENVKGLYRTTRHVKVLCACLHACVCLCRLAQRFFFSCRERGARMLCGGARARKSAHRLFAQQWALGDKLFSIVAHIIL